MAPIRNTAPDGTQYCLNSLAHLNYNQILTAIYNWVKKLRCISEQCLWSKINIILIGLQNEIYANSKQDPDST